MFTQHHDTRLLYGYLIANKDKEIITWEDLEKHIGYSVRQGVGYSRLRSAINTALGQDQLVFECVFGVGYKVVNASENVSNREAALNGIRRRARREQNKLACAKYDALNDSEKATHNALAAQYGVIRVLAGKKATKKIETASNGSMLSVQRSLQLFSKASGEERDKEA